MSAGTVNQQQEPPCPQHATSNARVKRGIHELRTGAFAAPGQLFFFGIAWAGLADHTGCPRPGKAPPDECVQPVVAVARAGIALLFLVLATAVVPATVSTPSVRGSRSWLVCCIASQLHATDVISPARAHTHPHTHTYTYIIHAGIGEWERGSGDRSGDRAAVTGQR